MSPGTKFRFRGDPQKSSSYIYRWKFTLTPAVIRIYPGTWWRLAKMKNTRNRSVRRQMCKRSWKLVAQNQQRPKRWGILNCKSGFTHCSRGLWGQVSSTIMLSLGWLSCSLWGSPLFRQQMVMIYILWWVSVCLSVTKNHHFFWENFFLNSFFLKIVFF